MFEARFALSTSERTSSPSLVAFCWCILTQFDHSFLWKLNSLLLILIQAPQKIRWTTVAKLLWEWNSFMNLVTLVDIVCGEISFYTNATFIFIHFFFSRAAIHQKWGGMKWQSNFLFQRFSSAQRMPEIKERYCKNFFLIRQGHERVGAEKLVFNCFPFISHKMLFSY